MPAVHLEHVSFRFTTAADVITDLSLHLGGGWTGVVGANGSGKTTLLRLIAGQLEPASGSIVTAPVSSIPIYCPQTVEVPTTDIEAFAERWDGTAQRLRGRLGLAESDLERWPSLSPGERKRWQIGAALAAAPDVLLLDEPTNHLDSGGRALLLKGIVDFDGVGLVVSHDRAMLAQLTTRTLRIANGLATLWSGDYETARGAWQAAEAEAGARFLALRKEERKAARRLADQRRAADAKRAQFRRQQRTAVPRDIDSRSSAATRRYREGEQSTARRLATTARKHDRLIAQLEDSESTKELGGRVFIDYEPAPKPRLAEVDGSLVVAGRVLATDVAATVHRGERIWLRGANGAGKTTLLHRLVGEAGLPNDRILFLPQELTSAAMVAILSQVRGLPPAERGRVLALVAALGSDPEALLVSDLPSPGEARKLAMALGLGRRAWLAVLDEPTNHLDLPSVERLEAALNAYPGALVVVTHDEAFAESLRMSEWHLHDGRLLT